MRSWPTFVCLAFGCRGSGDGDDSAPGSEGCTTAWFFDADRDGFGDPDKTHEGCTAPSDYVAQAGDCDDLDAEVHPDAVDSCDGVDNDCDALVDESGDLVVYQDADGDGHGDPLVSQEVCERPAGWTLTLDDCDDGDATVYAGAPELCDTIDNDCDGEPESGTEQRVYADLDGDQYGDPGAGVDLCDDEVPDGYSTTDTDCDDTSSTVHPGAPELCDGLDNNCDEAVESGVEALYYIDADGDLFGDPTFGFEACEEVAGYSANDDDCNDRDAAINPAMPELCNGADDDCDAAVDADDDDLVDGAWFIDDDLDGYGDDELVTLSCVPVAGSVVTGGDCDDTDSSINPDAKEICDEIDDDCDALVDDDDPSVASPAWYPDVDLDLYGDGAGAVFVCEPPEGFIPDGTDCDDTDEDVHPFAEEYCDGIDNDCDSLLDALDPDGASAVWYADVDGDGYGDRGETTTGCDQPLGYVTDDEDCDDDASSTHPGATEVWYDDVDEDCSGGSDFDQDADGYDDADTIGGEDCDDRDAALNPDGTETCDDGIDQDCTGSDLRCAIGGDLGTSTAPVIFDGVAAGDNAGDGIAIVPDLNGDGIDDVAIGASGYDTAGATDAGALYVVFGVPSGTIDLATADVFLAGESASGLAGARIMAGGDANDDGAVDLLVNAVGDDDGGTAAGAAYLIAGPLTSGTAGDLATDCYAKLVGAGDFANAGSAMSAYDIDGDATDDVIIGAQFAGTGGEVYVELGPLSSGTHDLASSGVTLTASATFDYFGTDLTAGDLDGDGVGDLFVSAPYAGTASTGEQYVFYGPITADRDATTADVTIASIATFTGVRIASDGDVNGDGQPDLLVGSPFEATTGLVHSGTVYVFYGPLTVDRSVATPNALIIGSATSDYAGMSVDENGDIDQDGSDDVVIGAVGATAIATPFSGVVYVAYGPVSGTRDLNEADARLYGESASSDVGYDAVMGDVNGDSFVDVLVGAAQADRAATNAGAAFLFFGDE